jgi:hypothetical protein
MIAEPLDLLGRFLANVFLERKVAGNHGATEHEVLPDENAELIADVVKVVGFVIAAAPMADHVHVRVFGGLQGLAMLGGGYAGRKTVEGDDVGPFAEDRDAVDDEGETFPPLVIYAAKFDGAKTGAEFGVVLNCGFLASAGRESAVKLVKRLGAVSVRIPTIGIRDAEGEGEMVCARVEAEGLIGDWFRVGCLSGGVVVLNS